MGDYLARIIYELLQFRRSPYEATSIFSSLKHNVDLCPKFQAKLESVYDAFDKYQTITYDIQGPRDQGTDILVRQRIDDENRYICFQIKSNDDLKKSDYLKVLKAQYFDT